MLAAFVAGPCVLAACKKTESKPAPVERPNIRKDRYTVRGQVAMLPAAENPSSEFQVRHEAIPHFVGQDGKLGMDTMTMPFPLAEGMVLPALKVGDPVELTFEVDFDTSLNQFVEMRAVAVSPLPAGTELDFSSLKR